MVQDGTKSVLLWTVAKIKQMIAHPRNQTLHTRLASIKGWCRIILKSLILDLTTRWQRALHKPEHPLAELT
jgi:hypothetical protein